MEPSHPESESLKVLGLLAGNGRFPFLVLEEARRLGLQVVTVAIEGETDPAIQEAAESVHWVALGQVSHCVSILREAGARQAIMAGQVRHRQIFASLAPDPLLPRVMNRLKGRNPDAILGALAEVLEEEGIRLMDSTSLLRPLLATAGVMGRHPPSEKELADISFGFRIAREIARLDIGQTVVVRDKAVVAVEAMEGTDETIRRAGTLLPEPAGGLTVVKVARPTQDTRFDVPIVGPRTIDVMVEAGASVLAVEAQMSLLLDREELIRRADRAGIALYGQVSSL